MKNMKINKLISSFLSILIGLGLLMTNPFFYTLNTAHAAREMVNDADITSVVKNKISANNTLSNTNIQVSTKDGVVKLSGKVDSIDQMTTAAELAQATTGVQDVNTDDIEIANKGPESKQPFMDALITAKVKGMFIQKKLFSDADIAAMSISVETNNGMVTLSGTAASQKEIDNATKIAKSIKGVKNVKSTVTIKTS